VPNPQTNLRVLKSSNKKPLAGDIFVMQLPDETYLFGRVIGAGLEPPHAPMPLSYLVYVYAHRSKAEQPSRGALRCDRLLLPPVFINRMPWTKGYFKTVEHEASLTTPHCRSTVSGTRRGRGRSMREAIHYFTSPSPAVIGDCRAAAGLMTTSAMPWASQGFLTCDTWSG